MNLFEGLRRFLQHSFQRKSNQRRTFLVERTQAIIRRDYDEALFELRGFLCAGGKVRVNHD